MKKENDIKNVIPRSIRTISTIKANNVEEKIKGELGKKYQDFQYSVEAFNDSDIFCSPDRIGITIFYPDKDHATHTICAFYPFNIKMNELGIEINNLFKTLESKIPEKSKTPNLKMKDKN